MCAPSRRSFIEVVALVLFVLWVGSGAAHAQSGMGACCLPTGDCQTMTAAQCSSGHGLLLDGQACGSCARLFGCCVGPVSNCQTMSASNCAAQHGSLYSTCTPDPCTQLGMIVTGACCNQDTGACTPGTLQSQCPAPSAFFTDLACSPNPCATLGACCTGSTCTQVVQASCPVVWAANTSCTNAACGLTGSCCNVQSSECVWTTIANCQGPLEQFNVGSICSSNNLCYRGACCWSAGLCFVCYRYECSGWFNPATFLVNNTCTPNPCYAANGACCTTGTSAGGCAVVTAAQCASGLSFTPGGTCFPNTCPSIIGACCCPGGSCQISAQAACTTPGATPAGGTMALACNWFPNQLCGTLTCPPIGACCAPGGPGGSSCTITTLANCSTTASGVVTLGQWTQNILCTPDPCGNVGACCDPSSGACGLVIGGACIGVWYPNYPCAPNPCQPGGCCNTYVPSCTITTRAQCNAHGLAWLGDGVPCVPALCVIRTGACCGLAPGTVNCASTSQFACAGTWHANSTCSPNPCCIADLDGNNTVAVADIFGFLNVWFAGCP